jgi:hypothetical protein
VFNGSFFGNQSNISIVTISAFEKNLAALTNDAFVHFVRIIDNNGTLQYLAIGRTYWPYWSIDTSVTFFALLDRASAIVCDTGSCRYAKILTKRFSSDLFYDREASTSAFLGKGVVLYPIAVREMLTKIKS